MPQFKLPASFPLLSGEVLREGSLYYEISDDPSSAKDVVWVCHAFTGNATVKDWWPSLFKENGGFIDQDRHIVVCVNILGSCYGSTGPLSINPETGKIYAGDFPELHNRDIVNSFILLRKALKIKKIDYLIGGSLGGQQALEWSISEPELIKRQVLIASNVRHSAWGIAFNELQRKAIHLAGTNSEKLVQEGLSLARSIAMLSYRCYDDFELRQSGKTEEGLFKSASYLSYQGDKFHKRFNPFSYTILTKMLDTHDISFKRDKADSDILKKVLVDTLCIGIDSDVLFPLQEQKYLHSLMPNSRFEALVSDKGHDAFLLEGKAISVHIGNYFKNKEDEKV